MSDSRETGPPQAPPPERDARFQVLGTLGAGRLSPLVAEQIGPGALRRRVVLARPWPADLLGRAHALDPECWALPEQVVHTAAGARAVVGLRGLADLDACWEALGAPGEGVRRALATAVLDALRPLHQAGLGHGALSGATIRLVSDGGIVLVQPVGGTPEQDREALADALELEALGEAGTRGAVAEWLGDVELPLQIGPHPLVGTALVPQREAPRTGPPSKDPRLALIGAFIATLSGAMAWMYAQPVSGAVVVSSGDGHGLEVECEEGSAHSGLGPIELPTGVSRCRVFVYGERDTIRPASLDARFPGIYRCRVVGGGLQCAAP